MKRLRLVLIIVVSLVLLILLGMLLIKHFITDRIMDGDGMENITPMNDPTLQNEPDGEPLDLVGISYYFHHGSMAGMDYSYSISKDATGVCIFSAEVESGACILDREIPQEEFDAIMQLVSDNYVVETIDESANAGEEYVALDANSSGFDAILANGHTQAIELGEAGSEVVAKLEDLLEGTGGQGE